jgi:hypothetical protein
MSVPKNHGLSPAFDSGHGRGRIYNDIAGDGHCDIGDARQQVAFVLAARAQSARELMSGDLLLQNNRTALVEPYQMERVLADVDPNRADCFQCILRCARRMILVLCFTPPDTAQQLNR